MQTIQLQDGIAEWKGKVSKVFFYFLLTQFRQINVRVGITKDERINECMNGQCNFCVREKRKQMEYKIPSMLHDV